MILTVVYTKGLKGFSGIVGLDIFFSSFISGASMNSARSLAPALLSGNVSDLWLYWSATFTGTMIIAFALRKKLAKKMKQGYYFVVFLFRQDKTTVYKIPKDL